MLMFISLLLFIIYEQRMAAASKGVNCLQARMIDIFNDNELIADAIGGCYHHIKAGKQCGDISKFALRSEDKWGISTGPKRLYSAAGTVVAQQISHNALCMYTTAEFVRGMANEPNPGSSDAHRYIIAKNSDYFYRFMAPDSCNFSSSNSETVRDIIRFFYPPTDSCTRLLQENARNKALSSTNFYTDKITSKEAYSVVSYIYDPSGKEISDQIIVYLVYDHSEPGLQKVLAQAFDNQIPPELNMELVNLTNHESLCLSGKCTSQPRFMMRSFSEKYALRYLLSLGRSMVCDTHAGIMILLAPFFSIMISFSLKS